MKKIFLIPLLACFSCVMAWADNIAQITIGEAAPVGYETLSDLQTAIAALPTDGTVATIQLLEDIDGGTINTANMSVFEFPASTKTVLDLNGHTLSAALTSTNYDIRITTYVINNKGELTINDSGENGKIKNSHNALTSSYDCMRVINNVAGATMTLNKCIINNGAMGIDNRGTLTINEDVTIEVSEGSSSTIATDKHGYYNGGSAICARSGSHTTINGGLIKSHNFNALFTESTAIIAINGGDFYGVNAVGWLYDGMTYSSQMTISGGSFDKDPTVYVDQNHYADLVASRYEIKDIPANASYTVYSFAELKEKLNLATNDQAVYVTLGADINVAEVVTLQHGSQLTIPAGRTLTVQDGGLFVNEGKTVNQGTIATVDNGFFSNPASALGNGSFNIAGLNLSVAGDVVTYIISNGMQLQYLAYLVAQDAYADKTWNISLTTDINLPTEASFERISSIEGTFDGNNYAINNLTINAESGDKALIGLFNGTFQNVVLTNINVYSASGCASALFTQMVPNSVVKNVKLKGSVTSGTLYATAFVSSMYNSGMETNDHLWFVNCESEVTLSTGGYFAGWLGTVSGTKGTFGFYNCVNKGNISATYAGVLSAYHTSASKSEVIAFTNTGTVTASNTGKQINGVNFIGTNSGTFTYTYIDPTKYTAVYDESQGKYIPKEAGTIDNTNSTTTDWATNTTWTDEDDTTPVVPTEADKVTVNSTVIVNDGTDAEANKVTVAAEKTLTIKDGGSLTIGENGLTIAADAIVKVEKGATLVIGGTTVGGDKGGITIQGEGEHAGKLIVEATQADGTGVVLVDPEAPVASTRVEAEVELIPDAYKVSEDVYKHRYIGIPLYFEGSEVFTSANWSREPIQGGESVVSHAKTWNNGWQDVTDVNEFVPFKGYALTNESTHGVKYTFKGKLVGNGDGTMNFAYGFNLFANSYTAPINIQTLLNGLSNDVKATIYMFKNDKLQTVSKADFAGFRTPKFTVIPSLQAFFVLMDDGTSATEDINYAEAVYNNSLPNSGLYAPKRQETPAFNRVRINIAAENGASDEVYLIEAADYTNNFENGFDEVKYMNNGLNLFATTAYGRQSTEITNNLSGTFIGVQGNGTYTMTFDELVGEEYQIRDLQTNAVVTMSEANTYTFTANGTNDARFVVEAIAKTPTALGNVDEVKMFVHDNTLFISENNSDANVMVYAANGQLVLSATAQQTISLNGLANGVYTVRVANQTLKFVK